MYIYIYIYTVLSDL